MKSFKDVWVFVSALAVLMVIAPHVLDIAFNSGFVYGLHSNDFEKFQQEAVDRGYAEKESILMESQYREIVKWKNDN